MGKTPFVSLKLKNIVTLDSETNEIQNKFLECQIIYLPSL